MQDVELENQEDNESEFLTTKVGLYIFERTLGEGTFGKVKLATHTLTGEQVAIKILDRSKILLNEDKIRVENELFILQRLKHKNIIQLFEIIHTEENIYLIMEFAEGGELFDYISKKEKLSEIEACKFFQQIIMSLDYLHSQSIVHRDLKPENLLLDHKKSIKISDFGLSRKYSNEILLKTSCGTPSYAPPEMINGDEYHGLLTDIWSAGVIVYAMLAGYLPFYESCEDVVRQKINLCEYEIPDHFSNYAKDLLSKILVIDPFRRITLGEIKAHPWFNLLTPSVTSGLIVGKQKIPVDEELLEEMEKLQFSSEDIRKCVQENKFDNYSATYYILVKKKVRSGGVSISDFGSELFYQFVTNEKNFEEIPQHNEVVVEFFDKVLTIEEEKGIDERIQKRIKNNSDNKITEGKDNDENSGENEKNTNEYEKIYNKFKNISNSSNPNRNILTMFKDKYKEKLTNNNSFNIERFNTETTTFEGEKQGKDLFKSNFALKKQGKRIVNSVSPHKRDLLNRPEFNNKLNYFEESHKNYSEAKLEIQTNSTQTKQSEVNSNINIDCSLEKNFKKIHEKSTTNKISPLVAFKNVFGIQNNKKKEGLKKNEKGVLSQINYNTSNQNGNVIQKREVREDVIKITIEKKKIVKENKITFDLTKNLFNYFLEKKKENIHSESINIDNSETLIIYYGIIDLDFCFSIEIDALNEKIEKIIKNLKISFLRVSKFKFKLTKTGTTIDCEIYALPNTDMIYLKTRKIQGNHLSYLKLITVISDSIKA